MPTVLLFLEFLGTTEVLVIALVALIIFGPRKLPEIGRTVGKSLAEFKRASDEFKRTWEYEVELESRKPALDTAPASYEPAPVLGEAAGPATAAAATGASVATGLTAEESYARAPQYDIGGETVARGSSPDDDADARRRREEEDELNAS